jgi:hypothetical protein
VEGSAVLYGNYSGKHTCRKQAKTRAINARNRNLPPCFGFDTLNPVCAKKTEGVT